MNDQALDAMALASNARKTVVAPGRRTLIDAEHLLPTQRAAHGDVPRFERYHAPISMCSNKLRMVLAEQPCGIGQELHLRTGLRVLCPTLFDAQSNLVPRRG